MRSDLAPVFEPQSIAVAGASANVDSPGYDYVRCLREFGFGGPVYPVNPRLSELLGYAAFPSLADVPGTVDFVISCVPAEAVPPLLQQCPAKGVRVMQLFTGRFGETGREEGAQLEASVLAEARSAGVRLIGPNCMGLHHPGAGISFRPDLPRTPGPAAFLSQSGNIAVEVILHSAARGLFFGKAVSYGNGLDLDQSDFLEYLAHDPDVRVVAMYVEGTRDGRRLLQAMRRCAQRKPVVALKGGRTGSGARSAASHTAALAGTGAVWHAAFRQAGVVEVATLDELIDATVAFAFLPPPTFGLRVGVVGGGGGRAVQSADLCEEAGLVVPPLPEQVRSQLREKAPALWDWVGNPVDQSILAGSGLSGVSVLQMMLETDAFDLFIGNLGEDWVLGRPDAGERLAHLAERFAAVASAARKPVALVLGPADSPDESRWRAVESARQRLVERSLAVFPSIDRAALALARYARYWESRLE